MLHLQGDQGSAPAQGFPLPPPSAKAAWEAPGEIPAPLTPCGPPHSCRQGRHTGTRRQTRGG